MAVEKEKAAYRLLLLIATPRLVDKAIALFRESHVPVQYQFRAQGTATSEIMDLLGLGSVEKMALMSEMPKAFADAMLVKLKKKLYLGMPNSGVAFTIAISGGSNQMIKMIETMGPKAGTEGLERNEHQMAENQYSMIMAVVNQGFSEDVMDAAKPVGATGGTVFHCRRIGSEEAMRFWGISVQQEREIVMILARKADKLAIMQAIGKHCGMQSPAQGVVFSLPVDSVVGLD